MGDDDDISEPDYIKEFIDEQKKKFKWGEAAGAFYETLVQSHISHVDLQEKLKTAGINATGEAADNFSSLVSGAVKYRTFLEGLLHKDEKDLTGDNMIPFKSMLFREGGKKGPDSEQRAQIKESLKDGRMAVTDQRLIFICLLETGENSIKKVKKYRNKEDKLVKGMHYTVDASFIHNTTFFPMDIQAVKHIRFKMQIKITSKKRIKPIPSKCQMCGKGCALCCRNIGTCCCCCPKTWINHEKDTSNKQTKILVVSMAITLPPWG